MALFDFKHHIAPINFEEKEDYIVLSNIYSRFYLITGFPPQYLFGLFNVIESSETIRQFCEISYSTKLMEKSVYKAITKEMNALERKLNKVKDVTERAKISEQISELSEEAESLSMSGERTLDVIMILKVNGRNLEELNNHSDQATSVLSIRGFQLELKRHMQEIMFRMFSQLWSSDGLPETLKYNYGTPISTASAAAFWPYHYEEIRDLNGTLFGFEMYRRGLIQINPFLWLDDPKSALPLGINSGNWMILGAIGSGKTTAANKFVRHYIRNGIKFIWIDPEETNKSEVRKYHGEYIEFGLPGNFINVLDLRPIAIDGDEQASSYRYNTMLAKNAAIRDLKEIIKVYHNNDPTALSAIDVLDDVVLETYEEKGITNESFESYTYDDYPILSDVVKTLDRVVERQSSLRINGDKKLEQLTNLQVKLTPMIKADGQFFDGHTNISFAMDDRQKILGIGTKILDSAGERVRNSIFYLIMRYAEGVIFARDQYSAAVFEEAHRFINLPYCLERMENMWLRDRKYHSVCGLIMQEVSPFVRSGNYDGKAIVDFSRSIFNNTIYKMIMNLDRPAINDLVSGKLVNLNENEQEAIFRFTQGQGLLLRAKDKYSVSVTVHKHEKEETEPNS
ncbi:MAG: hypothetical protein IIU37_04820 [Erysipelotrichaceae bacterium]|nr:hypothetical protein [Erysipelotrichaceae bacterium]